MAERQTQAPVALSVNEQSPVNEQATTNPGHIDQSGYSKTPLTEELVEAKGLDQDLPNNTEELNAKLEEHPVAFHEGTITTEKPANKRWTVKRGIAAAAIGIATAGGIFGAQKAFGNEYIEGEDGMLYSPDVVATAPMLANEAPASSEKIDTAEQPLDPAITDPEKFATQSYEAILSTTVPFLEERREDSLQKIDEYFASRGEGSIPKREEIIFNTEENMKAQDIERQIAADTYTITDVAQTQPILAENLARAVFKNPTSYQVFVDNDLDGLKHATNMQAFAVSGELNQGDSVGTHEIDGPSLVLLSGNMLLPPKPDGNQPLMNRVVTKYTYDDNKSHYALVYQITEDNPHFIEYPENIVPVEK